MSEINVISRTQQLIVDVPTRSVNVVTEGIETPSSAPVSGSPPEWGRFNIVGGNGIVGPTPLIVGWVKQAGSSGVTLPASTRITVPKDGLYAVTSNITLQGGGNGWVICEVAHYRFGNPVFPGNVVDQIDTGGSFVCVPGSYTFDMLAGDYVQVTLSSSFTGQNIDGRSWLSISEVPANIGPQGPKGDPGGPLIPSVQDWIPLPLLNGWQNFGGEYDTPAYMKDPFGFVHVKGLALHPSNRLLPIATLPIGYRPALTVAFGAPVVDRVADLRIGGLGSGQGDGTIKLDAQLSAISSHCFLDSISFRAR